MTAEPINGSASRSKEQVERDIERLRGELSSTLDAIEEKLNVPLQVRRGVTQATARLKRFSEEDPVLLGVIGAAAVAVVGGVVWAAVAASRR